MRLYNSIPRLYRCKVCLHEKYPSAFDWSDGRSETCRVCIITGWVQVLRPTTSDKRRNVTPKTRVFKEDGLWQHYCPKTREFMRYWFWESAIHSANNCTKRCRKNEET